MAPVILNKNIFILCIDYMGEYVLFLTIFHESGKNLAVFAILGNSRSYNVIYTQNVFFVKPVINLNPNSLKSGTGTRDDSYFVE